MLKNVSTATIMVVVLNASLAMAQTNASKASAVGTWKMDLKQSTFGSEAPPKSVTLNILKDTPDASAWRVDVVDDKGQSHSYSWSGPTDGTMQDLKTPDGQVAGKESVKRDGDTLIRHGENPKDGSSFDARSTLSAGRPGSSCAAARRRATRAAGCVAARSAATRRSPVPP